jgi:hypothetical protein
MKQLFLLFLFLGLANATYAQKDYSQIIKKQSFESLLDSLDEFETTAAAVLFEQMSKQDTFIKEQELWTFFLENSYSGNFMDKINIERVAKLMMNEYPLLFIGWYGEEAVLNKVEHILNETLWQFKDDKKALDKFLMPICKDEVQIIYVRERYLSAYTHEMTGKQGKIEFDTKKWLNQQLKKAKKNSEKAKIYKDAARLSCLFESDMNQALEWAEMCKKLQADKEIYFVLAKIYTNMGLGK